MSQDTATVLIVDDLEVSRIMLSRGLKSHGFDTLVAGSGAEAIRIVDSQPVDIVLMDVMMPGMSGTDALRLLRSSAEHANLPIIMVTSYDAPEGVSQALDWGASDYITKPVNIHVTVARIRSQIERKRAIDQLRATNASFREQVKQRTRDLERINDELRGEIRRRRDLETELREATRKAESANRAKSDFLATMSHELRTPLNSIIGFSDLIRLQLSKLPDGERLEEYASYINDGGNHLLGIVNDILDLSKIDAGRTVLNESHVAIEDMAERSVRMVDGLLDGHTIDVVVSASLADVEMFCDEILMRRAMVNLISNAVKFSDGGTTIRVSADMSNDGDLVLSVADQGVGIAAEDIPKVMEPFGQASSELSRSHVGTGLGVPLTKSLIELHDGRFELTSEPGVGTTVKLYLPGSRLTARTSAASHSVA
ncbi:response regulator [Minwuia sp.]|uniref:hybrid sensor histidine kinase/response regulator n=1 Tax=Minwuia sp. TaxID=2493630 RepID=UPI003A931BA6